MNILEVENLCTEFDTDFGAVRAVRDVSFTLGKNEIVGVVGESGSGKTQAMYSIMGLLAQNGRVTKGKILLDGENISSAGLDKNEARENEKRMQKVRGKRISMIFQDPMTFLNPLLTVGAQITEVLRIHEKMDASQAKTRAIELMDMVGIPAPVVRFKQYPHEFSGGMRQRIVIAIALACNAEVIIADEPTTALDVTIQAQVLDLIRELAEKTQTSVILITHDLGVVASMCHRVMVMYGGRIVERGTADEVFYHAQHPYTQGLLGSINNPELDVRQKLKPIPGLPPDMLRIAEGCPFVDRCTHAMKVCKLRMPPETRVSDTQQYSCWLPHKDGFLEEGGGHCG